MLPSAAPTGPIRTRVPTPGRHENASNAAEPLNVTRQSGLLRCCALGLLTACVSSDPALILTGPAGWTLGCCSVPSPSYLLVLTPVIELSW